MLHHFETQLTDGPDGTFVLAVTGELDLASAAHFREAVGEAMGTGARNVVVDLSGSDFIDSSGIGALMWAEHRLQAVGGELTTKGCQPPVERAFKLAGLSQLIH